MLFAQSKGETVKILSDKPVLDQVDLIYWSAWCDLQGEAVNGFNRGAIPLPSILAWCKLQRITEHSQIHIIVAILRKLEEYVAGLGNNG